MVEDQVSYEVEEPESGIKVLPHEQGLTSVNITEEFVAICPVPNRPYSGLVTVTFEPGKHLLEFESLRRWLLGIGKATIEDVCAKTFAILDEMIEPIRLEVIVTARTPMHGRATATKKHYFRERT